MWTQRHQLRCAESRPRWNEKDEASYTKENSRWLSIISWISKTSVGLWKDNSIFGEPKLHFLPPRWRSQQSMIASNYIKWWIFWQHLLTMDSHWELISTLSQNGKLMLHRRYILITAATPEFVRHSEKEWLHWFQQIKRCSTESELVSTNDIIAKVFWTKFLSKHKDFLNKATRVLWS